MKYLKPTMLLASIGWLSCRVFRVHLVRADAPRSTRAQVADMLIRLVNRRGELRAGHRAMNYVRKQAPKNTRPYFSWLSLLGFDAFCPMDECSLAGLQVMRFGEHPPQCASDARPANTSPVVVYVHGNGYAHRPIVFQEWFARHLARRSGAVVYMPIYPLAPTYSVDDALGPMREIVEKLQPDYLVGDSAGGGLALVLAQNATFERPPELVLVSPWLDVSMSNDAVPSLQRLDSMLDIATLRAAGKLWAKERSLKDPLVSPIYGDVAGLGVMHVFIGTHDLFHADAVVLKQRVQAAGGRIAFYEAPGMNHVWPLFPLLPEARQAREAIANIIKVK